MKERELLMETHLKDAQLKYLRAQINPHFLFNSLNAGAQLALMEDAEKTSIFIEKMADFFRYNVRKTEETATLEEELEAVDSYVYILNVRFAGEIHYEKEVYPGLENLRNAQYDSAASGRKRSQSRDRRSRTGRAHLAHGRAAGRNRPHPDPG